jgi:phosphoesterase RecJ-like protein
VIDAATGRAIGAQIASAGRILVITHVAPDGDALGSLTGTGLILQQLGKEFSLVCDDGLLPRFRYLPLSSHVRYAPDSRQRYDLVIAVDAGDQERMGQAYADLPEPKPPIVNIDHHITNTRFGRLNLVCEDCNATAEVLFTCCHSWTSR